MNNSVIKNQIIAIHLLNDFSGSPLVLSNCIKAFLSKDHTIDIVTNNSDGFLNNLDCNYTYIPYKNMNNKFLTLLSFFFVQFYLFFLILGKVGFKPNKSKKKVLVNTILPFGGALAAKIIGVEVIYYVHETSIKPVILKNLLKFFLRLTYNKAIYVSNYLKITEGQDSDNDIVIYNSLPPSIPPKKYLPANKENFIVFMPCSLKVYKGVFDFVELARLCLGKNIQFMLALNAEENEFNDFKNEIGNLDNLKIYRRPDNMIELYERSSIIVNLSHPDKWIETFGMTIVEAYSFGLPVIVPTIGGIAEIVDDNITGYTISVEKLNLIKDKIIQLSSDKELYLKLSNNAYQKSLDFSFPKYQKEILEVL